MSCHFHQMELILSLRARRGSNSYRFDSCPYWEVSGSSSRDKPMPAANSKSQTSLLGARHLSDAPRARLSDGRSRSQECSITCSEQNLPPHLLHFEVPRTPQTLHTDDLRPLKYASRFWSADDSSPLRHHVDVLEGAIFTSNLAFLLFFSSIHHG